MPTIKKNTSRYCDGREGGGEGWKWEEVKVLR